MTRTWLNGQLMPQRYHIVGYIFVFVCLIQKLVEHTSPELSINWEHFVHMQRQCWQCQLSALLMTCNKRSTAYCECTADRYPVEKLYIQYMYIQVIGRGTLEIRWEGDLKILSTFYIRLLSDWNQSVCLFRALCSLNHLSTLFLNSNLCMRPAPLPFHISFVIYVGWMPF